MPSPAMEFGECADAGGAPNLPPQHRLRRTASPWRAPTVPERLVELNRLCKLLADEVIAPREFAVVSKRSFDEIRVAAAQRPCRIPRQQNLDFVALRLFIDCVHGNLVRLLCLEQRGC
jgi:hypothetical protein